jgi:sugar lactone lactonase YvrE
VAVDAAGNLYVADSWNHRIRKVSSSGVITTVAGNGERGFSGDGGPATSGSLNFPCGVALGAAGNMYIADYYNNRTREVSTSGTINTVAGTGAPQFYGDGGPATSASLHGPKGVALDGAGNLYIADYFNNRIRKVGLSGIISTVAGNGTQGFSGDGGPATSASLSYPAGVAVDAAGNLYIGDTYNHRIRNVTPSGNISTVAGNGTQGFSGDGGPGTGAALYQPMGVAVDTAGNLYIADYANCRIRKVTPSGTITTVAGNGSWGFSGDGGPATNGSLSGPAGLAVDAAGNLYVADTNNNRMRKVTPSGIISTVAGNGIQGFSGDGGPATSASLYQPVGVAVDATGNLYIADWINCRIRKVSTAGIISTVAGNGRGPFPATAGRPPAPR